MNREIKRTVASGYLMIVVLAVVVWKVFDTAEALFEVDDYAGFVEIQSKSALRNPGMTYPYEPHDGENIALRCNPQEIANAMLRRQQVSAIIAARKLIVRGAVGMVQLALDELDEDYIVELDEERKAAKRCSVGRKTICAA
jgi:hypothetical protein